MKASLRSRGGVPVGYVAELGEIEEGAVRYLRKWFDGPDAQAEVWGDFSRSLGTQHGRSALRSLEQLCDLNSRYGRRPLMHHMVDCKCLGADESCFANLVACAAEGAREDAMLMAMLIVRPDFALPYVGLAECFGLALKRMALSLRVERPKRDFLGHPNQKSRLH